MDEFTRRRYEAAERKRDETEGLRCFQGIALCALVGLAAWALAAWACFGGR